MSRVHKRSVTAFTYRGGKCEKNKEWMGYIICCGYARFMGAVGHGEVLIKLRDLDLLVAGNGSPLSGAGWQVLRHGQLSEGVS